MVSQRQYKVLFSMAAAIDAMSVDPGHTEHCVLFLLATSKRLPVVWKIGTRVYPRCTGRWFGSRDRH